MNHLILIGTSEIFANLLIQIGPLERVCESFDSDWIFGAGLRIF